MYKVLVNHLGGLRLPGKSVVRLTDRGRKIKLNFVIFLYLRAFKISCSVELSMEKVL